MVGIFQEADGSVSMRRVLSAFFSVAFMAASWYGFKFIDKGWIVFIPAIACLACVLFLLFFTTWNDITALVQAAVGLKKNATTESKTYSPQNPSGEA